VRELRGVSLEASDQLPRRLGLWATTAVVVGTIIGSGIFRVPASVAAEVGSSTAIVLVWVLGGVISLCGALSLAELAAALPQSGGVFVYLRQAYGPLIAFVFGWTQLFLAPASVAGISLVFAEYLSTVVPLSPTGVRAVAALVLLLVGAAGYRSVRGLGAFIGAAAVAKVAAIATLVLAAFLLGDGDAGSLGRGAPAAGQAHWGGVGLALVAALWAYNGIHDMICVAGEVKDPGRVLPRALLAGVMTIIVVYLAANAAYLYVLPFDTLKTSPLVASDTMVRVLGSTGAAAVAIMVMVSTLGATSGLGLAVPRIFYAMAREGLLFAPLARVHPRFQTPHVAVAFHTGVALVCVWSRSFEQLTEAFVLGTWPFLALAAAGVIVLRRSQPSLPRPYRTPGYPAVPIIFIVGTLWVVGSALVARPVTTLAGIGMTLLGVPVYLVWKAASRRGRQSDSLTG
jgi:APA family basic amino acid/polyamine antiporter